MAQSHRALTARRAEKRTTPTPGWPVAASFS
jgi:hypothetical protein